MKRILVMCTVGLWIVLCSLLFGPSMPAYAQSDIGQKCSGLSTLEWSPDGSMLAVGSSTGVCIYDQSLKELAHLEASDVSLVAWSPDGSRLAAGTHKWLSRSTHWRIYIWETKTWQIEKEIPINGWLQVLEWHPDGLQLAAGMENGALWIWNIPSGKLGSVISYDYQVRAVHWQDDTLLVASGVNYHSFVTVIHERDTATGDLIRSRQPIPGSYNRLVKSPLKHKYFVDDPLHLVGPIVNFLNNHPFLWIGLIVISPFLPAIVKRILDSKQKDKEFNKRAIRFWTVVFSVLLFIYLSSTLFLITFLPPSSMNSDRINIESAFSSDGKYVAVDVRGRLMIWDMDTGRRVSTIKGVKESHGWLHVYGDIVWLPSTHRLAIPERDSLILWDEDSGTSEHFILSDSERRWILRSVDWHPDGIHLATIYEGWNTPEIQQIVIWDTQTGQQTAAPNECCE